MKNNLTYGAVALTLLMASCQSPQTTEMPPVEGQTSFNVSGYVTDDNGKPLSGVKITTPDTVVYSELNGKFSVFTKSNNERYVLKLEKDSFFYHISSRFLTDTTTQVISLVPKKNTSFSSISSFDSDKGIEVKVDGATITIPANALMLPDSAVYNGKVNLSVVYLNPDNPRFEELMPGGDLCATMVDGDTAALVSYGMVRVEMESDKGEKLQLKSDAKAKLTFPVSSFQKCNPHDTIPLWWFDESTSLWREEGLTLNKGDYYEGYVGHFTWWNCDHYFKNGAQVRLYFLDDKGEEISTPYAIEFGEDEGVIGSRQWCRVPSGKKLFIRCDGRFNRSKGSPGEVCKEVPPLKKGERREVYVKTQMRKVKVRLVDEKGQLLHHEPVQIASVYPNQRISWGESEDTYFVYLNKNDFITVKVPRFNIEKEIGLSYLGADDNYTIECKTKTPNKKEEGVAITEKATEPASVAPVTENASTENSDSDDQEIYDRVEVKASYPGGNSAMSRDLSSRVVYPKEAMENGESGNVIVKFVVEKDGSLSNFSIVRHVSPLLDAEALRVAKTLSFMPAVHRGKVVRSTYMLPISFRIY